LCVLASASVTHTYTQPFYGWMDFVRDNLGEPVPEETFTHSDSSWSSIIPICFLHLLRSMASSLFSPRGHTKKCDQCIQCDRLVPSAEGQGALITPDSAISCEQEMGNVISLPCRAPCRAWYWPIALYALIALFSTTESANPHALQSFSTISLQVFFGLPLGLAPSTSYSVHFFTQSLSSFCNTCPYHRNLFHCSTKNMCICPVHLMSSLLICVLIDSGWELREQLQWRHSLDTASALPQKGGIKDYAPDGSWLQKRKLENFYSERRSILQEQRVRTQSVSVRVLFLICVARCNHLDMHIMLLCQCLLVRGHKA